MNIKTTREKRLPTFKIGQTSLIISLTASFLAALFFIGFYIAPEKTESIISLISSNTATYLLLSGLMCCGIMLAPLSLLCLIDV